MKRKNIKTKKWNTPIIVFIFFLFLMVVLYIQYCYLSLFPNIYGINMADFSSNRNTYSTTLYAKRGNIYDRDGNSLAIDVSSYTVIAYLSASRTGSLTKIQHVVDIKGTAEALSPILNMTVENLTILLNSNVYQVELGPGGRNITELTKTKIEELDLPGISFIESYKRYYPNGDFASYIVGYAKRRDVQSEINGTTVTDQIIIGELGIESGFEDILKGINGSLTYQRDKYGYKIPDTPEERIPSKDGSNIYLTINSNIQRIVEAAINDVEEDYSPEWAVLNIMDAKTGDILASSSSPSFDPNVLNITNYENPLTSFVYEPGSVMKIFTYMCAMEKGTYVGSDTYPSGNIVIGDVKIYDWNRVGWGNIPFDMGFQLSSNVGVSYLVQDYITKEDLRSCLTKYGFGSKTNISLPRELNGTIVFNYPVEVAAAAYGQGISITAIQMLKALTIIANNGKSLEPNIISKIVDQNGNTTYEKKVTESEQVVSSETVKYIKDLMYNTIHDPVYSTGSNYKVLGLDVIGKTGTAQIYNKATNSYSQASNDQIYSFAGMFPKEDPEIIIFASVKRPNKGGSQSLVKASKSVIESVGKYLGLVKSDSNDQSVSKYTLDSYLNKDIESISEILKKNGLDVIKIGEGNKIIDQYPLASSTVVTNDKVFLLTNGNIKMPNLIGYTRIEAISLLNLMNLKYEINGNGNVVTQNIPEQSIINDKIVLTLEMDKTMVKKREN